MLDTGSRIRTHDARGRGGSARGRALGLALVAAVLLGGCGGDGPPPLTDTAHWKTKLSTGDPDVIAHVVKQGPAAVSLVVALLQDENPNVVAQGGMIAQQIGKDAAAALPSLFAALERVPEEPSVMGAIRATGEAAIAPIVKILEGGNDALRIQVVKLLNAQKDRSEPALPALMAILRSDAGEDLKIEAMGAIASMGLKGEPARGLLQEIEGRGGDLGVYAGRAIKRLDSAQKLEAIRREEAAAAGGGD